MPRRIFDGPEFLVNTNMAGWQHQPSIAALPDGGFVAAGQE
jgi:hypothetical protein